MKQKSKNTTIIGIDPGTNVLGYGVLEIIDGEPHCVALGCVELSKFKDPYQKLRHIFERVSSLITEYSPDQMALEAPFYGENVQSMLKLGRAQGVAMAAALVRDLPVFEYAPRRIKQAITGQGAASKEQVAGLLKSILNLSEIPKKLDATDGLAVALAHYYQISSPLASLGGKSGWDDFIRKNQDRIIE